MPHCIIAVAVLSAVAIGIAGSNPYLPGGGDNAGYVAEAESLLKTGQRRQLFTPDENTEFLKPPLFSVLLAGIEAVLGRNIVAMKIMLALFAGAAVLAAAWTLRIGLEENAGPGDANDSTKCLAAFLAFWFALAPSLTLCTHDILSDVPYTFLAMLALGLAGRAAKREASFGWLVLLAGVLILANLLRSAALLCCAACAGYFCLEAFLRRREDSFRRLLTGSIILILLTAGAFAYARTSQQSYVSSISLTNSAMPGANDAEKTFFASFSRSAQFYALFLPGEIAGYEGFGPVQAAPILIVLGVLAGLAGIVRMLKRGQRLIPIGFILMQGPLLFFVYFYERYYLPSLALFICIFWVGCQAILDWCEAKGSFATLGAVFLIALAPAVSIVGILRSCGAVPVETASILEWSVGPAALAVALAIVYLKWRRPALPAFIAAVFLLCAASNTICQNVVRERHRQAVPFGSGWSEFYEAAQTIKAHARENDVVLSSKTPLVWFWTGIRGYTVQALSKPEQQRTQLAKAQWVIIDELVEDRAVDALQPILAEDRDQWEIVYRKNNTALLHRRP